jgi:alpha-D-xyloside xylohydrolase
MKFHRGAWLLEKGVRITPARRYYGHAFDAASGELHVRALDRNGSRNGGDCFEGTVLQIAISSPMPDVIRIRAHRHEPHASGQTQFELDYTLKSNDVRIDESAEAITYISGKLALRIAKTGDWSMQWIAREGGTGGGDRRFTTSNGGGLSVAEVDGSASFLVQRFSLGIGESIYGFGERFGPLAKNGQSVVIWNEDGGTNSEWSYKNVPFYLSSAGYGLLVNSPAKVEFEVGTERVNQVQFAVPSESLDYYVFLGPDPKDVLAKYTRLSGRPPVIPAWANGLWLSTSFTTNYDEATVNSFIDGMAERGIPLSVFHFDCFWMRERHWCDFEWDPHAFPDPRGMIERLKKRGLKVCVWINSYISGLSKLFDEGRRGGYFVKRTDGSVYQRDQWQPAMAIVDFSNPDAVRWFQSKLQPLLDMGVDSFKTDFGERIPDEGVVYHDGTDPKLMHNLYPHLYNKAVFELLERHHGKGETLVFARSATAGCQQFPVHWGGDCEATFESMAEDLRGGLGFCMSGPAFWSHDIGGFAGKADPAVFKRWLQFGLLSTHSRLHGSESYRVPWLFDEESVDVARKFARLKNRLFPYLHAAARDAHEKGWPVMRAMPLEFPSDPACRHLDRQYMLGDSLLVAPVFAHDGAVEYYLPAGTWTHLLTGERVEGGRWMNERYGFDALPLFARDGGLLAMSLNEDRPEWRPARDPAELIVTLRQEQSTKHRLVGSDGEQVVVSLQRRGPSLTATVESGRLAPGTRVVLAGEREPHAIRNGKPADAGPLGRGVVWTDPSRPLSFEVNT